MRFNFIPKHLRNTKQLNIAKPYQSGFAFLNVFLTPSARIIPSEFIHFRRVRMQIRSPAQNRWTENQIDLFNLQFVWVLKTLNICYFCNESFSVKSPHNTSEVECKKSYLYAVEISWDKDVILIFVFWTPNVYFKKK